MYQRLCLLLTSATFLVPAFADDVDVPEQLETVLVESTPETKQWLSASPVTTLEDQELRMKAGHSLGETLKNELGVSSQSFGPGVGTPVIRGQSGARVRVLSNGIGSHDASALSPDHASSVEALLAEKIEVLRGPAALQYGGGAIGGAVNVIDNRIPSQLPTRLLSPALEQRFDSASDESSTTMKVDGGRDALAYHLDGFYRRRDNLSIAGRGIDTAAAAITDPSLQVIDNPLGQLKNSAAEAISGSAGMSWIKDAGFAGASINNINNTYGIGADGSGEDNVQIAMRQSKYDFKSELHAPFANVKNLRSRLGYSDYQHTEIADGRPGAFFTNKAFEGRLELDHRDLGPLQGTLGFQAQSSDFNAVEKLTGQSIVPRSKIDNYGVFAVETLERDALTYQVGARVEQTEIKPDGLSSLSFNPLSASVGLTWQATTAHRVNLAITRSSRAPTVQELLTNGYHDATRSFERGNLHLKEEESYNLDLGYRYNSGHWFRAEVDLFHNWFVDYIFQSRSGQFVDEAGNDCLVACKPLLLTRQTDAVFKGFEAKLAFTLMENPEGLLDLTLFSDYTRGTLKFAGDVPRMPPLRYGLQLDYLKNQLTSYLRFTRADDQSHPGAFETASAGYFLLNAGVNWQHKVNGDASLMLFAKGNNLLNQNIRNSTSYLRNYAPEAGRGAEIGFRLTY